MPLAGLRLCAPTMGGVPGIASVCQAGEGILSSPCPSWAPVVWGGLERGCCKQMQGGGAMPVLPWIGSCPALARCCLMRPAVPTKLFSCY